MNRNDGQKCEIYGENNKKMKIVKIIENENNKYININYKNGTIEERIIRKNNKKTDFI